MIRYRVTANMLGAPAQMVISVKGDPYTTTDLARALQVAAECRSLPQGYRNVRVEIDKIGGDA